MLGRSRKEIEQYFFIVCGALDTAIIEEGRKLLGKVEGIAM